MAGYSGTPLAKKLGIMKQSRTSLVNSPPGFRKELVGLPEGVTFVNQSAKPVDLILYFVKTRSELSENFAKLASRLAPAGMLWIAWPKKASGVTTDLSFESVQKVGLAEGLVDTKICAVNEVWSGLRFVIRVKDRPSLRK